MAVAVLTNTPNYGDFFRQRVLLNTQYWRDYVTNRVTDIAALDGERDRIIKAISFALDLENVWPFVYELIVTFSPYMERRGHWETWNWLLDRAIKVAQQVEDTSGVITLSALFARLLQRQSRPEQAITHYRRTIRLARQTENYFETARGCTNLGFLYIEQGHWYRAEVLCCYALNIFEQLGSNHGRAHTENHLGLLYTRLAQWDKARQHLERACALWQAMDDHHGLMYGYINLGVLCIESGNFDQALPDLEKALQQATLTGEEAYIGKIYLNMGIVYRLRGELSQAEAYARQAEKIFRRFSNLRELANVWSNLGLACLDQGKWAEARQYLDVSLEARRKLHHQYDEIKSLIHLLEYELALGNRKKARAQLHEVERLIDPHRQVELSRHLQSLLAKYQPILAEG